MNRFAVSLKLVAFAAIAVTVLGYVALRYVGLDKVFRPGYTVHLELSAAGGIFTGAEVDLRGIEVGNVGELHVTSTGVRADLDIDDGVRIATDLTARVSNRSALGEQFVQLLPGRPGGPYLDDGSTIPLSRTTIPVAPQTLLADLDKLARSVPRGALTTTLTELGTTFEGLGPELGRLLDSTSTLTRAALTDLDTTIELLDDSRTVLDTQVASRDDIATFSTHLRSLVATVRKLDPQLARVFTSGIDTSAQVTDLLDDTQQALPVLLNGLLTVTDIANQRLPQIRKLLITFPHALEKGLTLVRPCDAYRPDGRPVPGSCHVDPRTGRPIYQAHFGFQLAPVPAACTQGYEGTTKYLPNGDPATGPGPRQRQDAPANRAAGCTASPDSGTPNVRGAQNAQDTDAASTNVAYYDPIGGAVVSGSGNYFHVDGTTGRAPSDYGALMRMGQR